MTERTGILAIIGNRRTWWFALRVLWLAILLMLVVVLGERGAVFFYQGF